MKLIVIMCRTIPLCHVLVILVCNMQGVRIAIIDDYSGLG